MALAKDLRFGVRSLLKSPSFTLAALGALALGIGANTAIFSVIHTVLLKPLLYRDSDRILQIARKFPDSGRSPALSGSRLVYIKDHAAALHSVGGMDIVGAGFALTGAGEPERIPGSRISAGIFDVLGTAPVLGRVFTAEEDKPGTEDVAVIGSRLWQRRFGGALSVIGSRIDLNGRPHTVIGVMPNGFLANGATVGDEVWVPLRMVFDPIDMANAYLVLARLKDGVSLPAANSELSQVAKNMRREFGNIVNDREIFDAALYREMLVGDVRPALLVLSGAVGLVLLIACANVANLLLARATGRQKEIAIRTAMGASRWQLLRQLLVESVLLALAASAGGLLLAWAGLRALLRTVPDSLPWSGDIGHNPQVLAFTVGLAILTGLLFGLAPAWSNSRVRISETLKEASGRSTAAGSTGMLRSGLVAVEVAVSVVLVVGAALLIQSFVRLRSVTMGFDPAHVLTMKMALQKHKNTQSMVGFIEPLLLRANAAPGVIAAGTVSSLPLELGPDWEYEIEGKADSATDAQFRVVSPRYFEAMGIRLVGGRAFTERDRAASTPVIIVNEAFVRKAFKKGPAIGQRLRVPKNSPPWMKEAPREIVGIVADVREEGLRAAPNPAVYVPQHQLPDAVGQLLNRFLPLALAVKTQGEPLRAVQTVRRIVLSVDPLQPVAEIRTMEEIVGRSTSRDQFSLMLMGIFAFVALVLAAIGIYGVISYSVSQRTQELGVRIALGASAADLLRMVMREGMLTSMLGVAVGLAGAYGLSRFLAQLLFSVRAADPATFAGVAALMLGVAFLANLLPALRATRIDPITALRYE